MFFFKKTGKAMGEREKKKHSIPWEVMNMLPASKVRDKAWRDNKGSFNEECP